MQLLRRAAAATVAASLVLALTASSVAAERPDRGCSDDFELWSVLDFRAYMNSTEFLDSLPEEGVALAGDILAAINSPAWLDGAAKIDANDDGFLCLKQKGINAGHLWGWIWNAVDNTKNPQSS